MNYTKQLTKIKATEITISHHPPQLEAFISYKYSENKRQACLGRPK